MTSSRIIGDDNVKTKTKPDLSDVPPDLRKLIEAIQEAGGDVEIQKVDGIGLAIVGGAGVKAADKNEAVSKLVAKIVGGLDGKVLDDPERLIKTLRKSADLAGDSDADGFSIALADALEAGKKAAKAPSKSLGEILSEVMAKADERKGHGEPDDGLVHVPRSARDTDRLAKDMMDYAETRLRHYAKAADDAEVCKTCLLIATLNGFLAALETVFKDGELVDKVGAVGFVETAVEHLTETVGAMKAETIRGLLGVGEGDAAEAIVKLAAALKA